MELEPLSSPQNGGGVGRLVAHFENKGFNPFEKTFSPPLPPRPGNNGSTTNHDPQVYQHHHNHHNDHNHQTIHQGPSSPPLSVNDFHSTMSFDALQFCPSSLSGVGQGAFNPNRIGTPLPSPDESWASFSSLSRVTSPIATSPPPMQYGSFADSHRVANPGVGSSSGQFGSLDGFMSSNRIQSPIAPSPSLQSPMVSTPVNQTAPTVGGTPGFAIWRPPGSENVKMENPSPPSNATNSAGYFKPPVPTTPKPNITVGNQFILELNPSSKAKGKAPAKPPAKPPRPKVPPPVPTPFSPGTVKQEPATPKPSDLLSVSATSPTPEPATGIISVSSAMAYDITARIVD